MVCGQSDVLGYPLQDEETLATVYWCSACIDGHSDQVMPFPPDGSYEDDDNDQASATDIPGAVWPEVRGNTKRQTQVAQHEVDAHPAFAQMERQPKRQRTQESGSIVGGAKNSENTTILEQEAYDV